MVAPTKRRTKQPVTPIVQLLHMLRCRVRLWWRCCAFASLLAVAS